MPRPALYKYTPGQASPEELESTFVGRHALLDQLLVRIRQWCDGAAPEHTLLLGPRGMGKTHLLRLLAYRAAGLPIGARLHVAVFPEESYAIGSTDDFLIEVWKRLERPESMPPAPAPARAAWVLDQLRALRATENARFLVLLDGFDLLLDQLREADEAQLHRLLTTEEHVCLVGTAAVVPAAVTDHHRPLLHLLSLERLRPFEAAQADELLRKRAEWADDQAVLRRWPELGPRARAVAELVGGNPRLLLMLYQSLQVGELPGVVEAFRALLDELTPFYKHVVESRAPQQRKLLALAAFHDRGASPSELASESGLPERQVSALLGALIKDGLLRRVRRPGARTSAYPFAEPLLRMWLQMRASPEGERRVHCIVEFFRVWYAGAGAEYRRALEQQANRASELLQTGEVPELRQLLLALGYLAEAAPSLDYSLQAVRSLLLLCLEDSPTREASEALLAAADRALELDAGNAASPTLLVVRGLVLLELGHRSDARSALGRAFELPADDPAFLASRGRLLARAGSYREAVADLNRALTVMPDEPDVLLARGTALRALGHHDEALIDFSRVLELQPDHLDGILNRGHALLRLGRQAEGLADLDRAVELGSNDIRSRYFRGLRLLIAGQTVDSLAEFERIVNSHPNDPDALCFRGVVLGMLGRDDEALIDFSRSLIVRPEHPYTLESRGTILMRLTRYAEALDDFNRALELEPASGAILFDRGLALLALGRSDEGYRDLESGLAQLGIDELHFALPIIHLAQLAATAAARANHGQARRALGIVSGVLQRSRPEQRAGTLVAALRVAFHSGNQAFSEEALASLSPLAEDPALMEPFHQAITYLRGGQDLYFLDALNPDLRRAVELVVQEFGGDHPSESAGESESPGK